jgi:Domain of unknown function (DUF5127)
MLMLPLSFLFMFLALFPWTEAQFNSNPLRPPAIPLAVKSPYLNSWQDVGKDGGNGGYLPGQWADFYRYSIPLSTQNIRALANYLSNKITAWMGIIRVDGAPYTWMGVNNNLTSVNQTAFEYTSTRSIFTLKVGEAVEMNVTFLSPITPDEPDLMRQSLVFSYLNVDVQSLDGEPHDVQLYADISAGKKPISQMRSTAAANRSSPVASQSGYREIIPISLSGIMV